MKKICQNCGCQVLEGTPHLRYGVGRCKIVSVDTGNPVDNFISLMLQFVAEQLGPEPDEARIEQLRYRARLAFIEAVKVAL